jgi:1-acyl-sn-glycerol-3-phosphate acyltransferase
MNFQTSFYHFLRKGIPFVARYWNRLEIRGLDHITSPGSKLLAVNHGGGWDFDNFTIMSALDYVKTNNPARKRIWLYAWDKWCDSTTGFEGAWSDIYRHFSAIPIHIEKKGKPPIPWEMVSKIVNAGELMVICPEGHSAALYEGYRLWRFYPGVIKIHLKYQIPILPTAMIGFVQSVPMLANRYNPDAVPPWEDERMLPFPLPFPWHKLIIHIGEPLSFPEYYNKEISKAKQFELAKIVRNKVKELISIYRVDVSKDQPMGIKKKGGYNRIERTIK